MDTNAAITELILILQSQTVNFDTESDILQTSIENAVDKYSKDAPQNLLVDIAGNGTQVLDIPVTFTYDFSVIESIEYPVDDTSADKTFLDEGDDYTLYRKPDGTLQVLMINGTPEDASDPIRIQYSKYIDTISDVLPHYEKAVIQLAAYYACLSEGQKAANTTNDGRALDFVDKVTSSQRYVDIGKLFKTNYENIVFGDVDAAEAAGKTVAASDRAIWNTTSRFNTPRIFHKDDE